MTLLWHIILSPVQLVSNNIIVTHGIYKEINGILINFIHKLDFNRQF